MKHLFVIAGLLLGTKTNAQTYNDSIAIHRQHYKEDFIKEERSPLKGNDTAYLRFFAPNERYRVVAEIRLTPDAETFDMPTYNGKTKKYKQYGTLFFKINGKAVSLQAFQSQTLINDPKYKDHLFVAFTDETTYKETYGGGRYIDLSTSDIKDGKIEIDFNKCYNPYCAYAGGYNCPIPPTENRLPVAIKAGEKLYGKEVKH